MFLYLTTLNLAWFLKETAPQVKPPRKGKPSNSQTTTTKDLWESLKRKYKTEDVGTKKFMVLLHEIHAEAMNLSEILQVAAMIEKLPQSWVEFKNYLKQKRKEMSVEDLAKGKGKGKNDKKGKGKAEYLAPKARIMKQKLQGTCYKCDQLGHRAANCKMPKRVNPHQANMVNDNMDMIAMVSHVIAMISKVDPVDDWIVDSDCTKHMTRNRILFTSYKAYDGGHIVFRSNLKGKVVGGSNITHDSITVTNVEHVSALDFYLISLGKDSDVMLIELIKDDEYPSEEELDENDYVIAEEEFEDHFDKFPTRRNFTYVLDFMIVEDISSVIDPRISSVVLGKPFVELSNMTYDSSLGVVNLRKEVEKIAYKCPIR
nr:hypothetical protein [Tanacetum cinerariifolium]